MRPTLKQKVAQELNRPKVRIIGERVPWHFLGLYQSKALGECVEVKPVGGGGVKVLPVDTVAPVCADCLKVLDRGQRRLPLKCSTCDGLMGYYHSDRQKERLS